MTLFKQLTTRFSDGPKHHFWVGPMSQVRELVVEPRGLFRVKAGQRSDQLDHLFMLSIDNNMHGHISHSSIWTWTSIWTITYDISILSIHLKSIVCFSMFCLTLFEHSVHSP